MEGNSPGHPYHFGGRDPKKGAPYAHAHFWRFIIIIIIILIIIIIIIIIIIFLFNLNRAAIPFSGSVWL